MDSLTQIVLGAAVGEVALGKKVGNKAMLYGAIAGTIPDLDVYIGKLFDTVTALEVHRGFTHSIVFALIFGGLFGWLISLYEKQASCWQWSKLMFLGFLTHALLDVHTTWGTQLFWPFDVRLAFKSIFVIDPLYTLPFMIFLIMAMLKPKGSDKRRKYNALGLIVSSSYLVVTLVIKLGAYLAFTHALDAQRIAYIDIDTKPTAFNTMLWSANVDTEDAYYIGYYSFLDTQPITFYRYLKITNCWNLIKTIGQLIGLLLLPKAGTPYLKLRKPFL